MRPEKAHGNRIPGAPRQVNSKPALAVARLIVGGQMRGACVPAGAKPVAQCVREIYRMAIDDKKERKALQTDICSAAFALT
ncbi:MAG: hypothetical protein DMG72_17720 [Acidobacteria bacterium]|nr:MAG: hypothetical protein DMG72_17720 [Acidobacteriota bacterium]